VPISWHIPNSLLRQIFRAYCFLRTDFPSILNRTHMLWRNQRSRINSQIRAVSIRNWMPGDTSPSVLMLNIVLIYEFGHYFDWV